MWWQAGSLHDGKDVKLPVGERFKELSNVKLGIDCLGSVLQEPKSSDLSLSRCQEFRLIDRPRQHEEGEDGESASECTFNQKQNLPAVQVRFHLEHAIRDETGEGARQRVARVEGGDTLNSEYNMTLLHGTTYFAEFSSSVKGREVVYQRRSEAGFEGTE